MKKFVLTTVVFGLVTCFAADAFALPRILPWRRNVYRPAPARAPVVLTTAQTDTGFRSYSYEPAPTFREAPVRTAEREIRQGFRAAGDKILGRY